MKPADFGNGVYCGCNIEYETRRGMEQETALTGISRSGDKGRSWAACKHERCRLSRHRIQSQGM